MWWKLGLRAKVEIAVAAVSVDVPSAHFVVMKTSAALQPRPLGPDVFHAPASSHAAVRSLNAIAGWCADHVANARAIAARSVLHVTNSVNHRSSLKRGSSASQSCGSHAYVTPEPRPSGSVQCAGAVHSRLTAPRDAWTRARVCAV